ncbi:MAG: hypothetical protein JWM67_1852 [Mycobacterium sp.]|jgi:hypothetical protein|nr:hypothetical protein [Mycobacterium sp.]
MGLNTDFYGVPQRRAAAHDTPAQAWAERFPEELFWADRFVRLAAQRDERQHRLGLINAHIAQGMTIERATQTVDTHLAAQALPPRRRRLLAGLFGDG